MAKIISKHTSGNPAGTIIPCGTSTALPRTLLCDGASYSVSAYPALFAAIGYSFGGSGASFNVPDARGIFLRGIGTNPDNVNNTTTMGQRQLDIFESHNHPGNYAYMAAAGGGGFTGSGLSSNSGGTVATNVRSDGGIETRPANLGVNYCIAY